MFQSNTSLADGTSRRFRNAARVVREAFRLEILQPGMCALEVGSGALRNAKWLARREITVDVVELPAVTNKYQSEYHAYAHTGYVFHTIPRRKYDAVISTFVLGTITPRMQRITLLRRIRRCLRPNGTLIIAVRGPGDVKTKSRAGRPWRDGFLTPNRTFIKPIKRTELLELCASVGLRPINNIAKLRSNSGIVDLVLEASR